MADLSDYDLNEIVRSLTSHGGVHLTCVADRARLVAEVRRLRGVVKDLRHLLYEAEAHRDAANRARAEDRLALDHARFLAGDRAKLLADELTLDRGDVEVKPFTLSCQDCDEAPATHEVWLDLRSAGVNHALARLCESCATEFADAVREGLPAKTTPVGPIFERDQLVARAEKAEAAVRRLDDLLDIGPTEARLLETVAFLGQARTRALRMERALSHVKAALKRACQERDEARLRAAGLVEAVREAEDARDLSDTLAAHDMADWRRRCEQARSLAAGRAHALRAAERAGGTFLRERDEARRERDEALAREAAERLRRFEDEKTPRESRAVKATKNEPTSTHP